MNVNEIWKGSREEQGAMIEAATLREKRNRTRTQQERLKTLDAKVKDVYSRRRALKVGAGGVIVLSGLAGVGAAIHFSSSEGEKPDLREQVYQQYLDAFEKIGQGDAEAGQILSFFKERRRAGYIKDGKVFAYEDGIVGQHFYTGILDPERDREFLSMHDIPGFAYVLNQEGVPYMLLQDVPVTPLFAGAVAAHEGLHIYQMLTGIEAQRPDGFIEGEHDAYTLEFRLLNNQTQGGFENALLERALLFPPFHSELVTVKHSLEPDDYAKISSVFPEPLSEIEYDVRQATVLVALNFVALSQQASTPEEARVLQTEYLRGIYAQPTPKG